MALVLTALLLGGASRPVYKYLSWPEIALVVMLIGGFFLYWGLIVAIERWVRIQSPLLGLDRILVASVMGLVLAVSYVIFPIAAALRGNTAHEAMILAGSSFLASGAMYGSTLAGGVPISPGPGWILLNLPFENPLTYWLITPLYIAAGAAVMAWMFGTFRHAAVCLLFLSTSPLFWELVVQGHDIVPLGFALAIVSLLMYRLITARFDGAKSLALVVLAGVIATARIVFVPFPLLLGLASWRQNRRVALAIGLIGIAVALGLNLVFFLASSYFQPAHLFVRGSSNVGVPLIAIGLIGEGAAAWYAYRGGDRGLSRWLLGVWLAFFIPLAFIAVGELRSDQLEFARWEGANYVFPCVPMYLVYIAVKLLGDSRNDALV